jgi:hypothetical protein
MLGGVWQAYIAGWSTASAMSKGVKDPMGTSSSVSATGMTVSAL